MKNSKKKLRGMTLVEVIIAIAVFTLLGMVLCGVGRATDAQQRAANKTNKTVNDEGPVAEAQNISDSILLNKDYKIKVKVSGSDAGKQETEVSAKMYSVEKGVIDKSTGNLALDADGNNIPDPDNESGNFKFFEINPPVVQPTT